MRRYQLIGAALAATLAMSAVHARAEEFHAKFSGFNEIGGLGAGETGAILSEGRGTLKLDLDKDAKTLTFTLTYSDLSSSVVQAHIHLGKNRVAGGVLVFFCGPAGSPAHQTCPDSGTVTGTLTAADVRPLPGQTVTAGNFDALEDALTTDTAYGNIHTVNFPMGEIRGQIRRGKGHDD